MKYLIVLFFLLTYSCINEERPKRFWEKIYYGEGSDIKYIEEQNELNSISEGTKGGNLLRLWFLPSLTRSSLLELDYDKKTVRYFYYENYTNSGPAKIKYFDYAKLENDKFLTNLEYFLKLPDFTVYTNQMKFGIMDGISYIFETCKGKKQNIVLYPNARHHKYIQTFSEVENIINSVESNYGISKYIEKLYGVR